MNFVADTCRGFLEISRSDAVIGREINIASNYEVSMADIVNLIREIMGSNVKIRTDEERLRPAASEVYRLWGDNTLLKELTGFSPEYDLKQGLKVTCEWFSKKENLLKYKSEIYNL